MCNIATYSYDLFLVWLSPIFGKVIAVKSNVPSIE